MNYKIKDFLRTLFRYLYFRMVRVCDIVFNFRKPLFSPDDVSAILLVEVQDIGDTIIASPCIRQIRKRFPHAEINMLVQAKSMDMVRYNPNIDNVFGVTNITSYPKLFRTAMEYRRKRFDLVISLSPSVRNNLIATVSGGKIISGYLNDFLFVSTNCHDHPIEVRGYKPLNNVTYYREEPLIVRALKAAAPFGVDLADRVDTELFLPEESRNFSDRFLAAHNFQPTNILAGLHPVCLNYFRNWPPEKFAVLGDRLVEHLKDVKIFLIGTDDDRETLDLIVYLMNYKDHVICDTTLSIIETASVIGRCNVLVGMDSCPSDISGALNIPTVHMHGPTDSRVTGPGGRRNFPVSLGLPCSPCGLNIHFCRDDKRCMRELDVSTVLDAALEAVEKYSNRRADVV